MRVSQALVRRLDRLSRRAHAFHRFAHHPLCDRYAGELIALRGRTRICRGCSFAALGGLIGASAASRLALSAWVLGLASFAGVLGMLLSMRRAHSAPPERPRTNKLYSRALPAFMLCASLAAVVRTGTATLLHASLAAALAVSCALWFAGYRRRGPDRSACRHCPERLAAPCTGFREIVRAERAFVRRAHQLLDSAERDRASAS